jgi:hypothetical protein
MERSDESRVGLVVAQLRRGGEQRFERMLTADSSVRRLVIDFWPMLRNQKRKQPHITLYELTVTRILPEEEAVESLYRREMDIRIFADDLLNLFQADSLALSADTTRLVTESAR